LGSGFGLGSWNTLAQQDGRNPFGEAILRMQAYSQNRRSVMPLLRNLGEEPPAAVAERIATAGRTRIPADWIAEADWRRW
jgi:hypothetical protein